MIAPAYPAFNIYSRIAKQTTALGPVSVTSVVDRMDEWKSEVIDENNYQKFGPRDEKGLPDHKTLQTIRPADVVGLYGGLSSTIPRLFELAKFYKSRGITTIAGGQHFTGDNIRDALQNGVDYVVTGEGEDSIRELLNALNKEDDLEKIQGIAFMKEGEVIYTGDRPPITDFDRLPLPDFSLVRYAKIKVYPVNWVRGCIMNCEFCTVKGKPRPSSAERVMEQIGSLVERHNAREFFIVDDLFAYNRKEGLKLCRMLADYRKAIGAKLRITVQIRLDKGSDFELLQAMREAGIGHVCIGFESPVTEELEAMNKKTRPDDMVSLTRNFHKAGFMIHGMFIFGYPLKEKPAAPVTAGERVKRFRKFIKKTRLDTIQVLLPVPLPGTEMTRRLESENRVFPRECIGWEYYDGNFPLIEPDPPLTSEDMQLAIRKIMGRFYRFKYFFVIGLNVLIFPAMFFTHFDIRHAWRRWYRSWRNSLVRFGGWMIIKRWTNAFKKGKFSEKLQEAHKNLKELSRTAEDSGTSQQNILIQNQDNES